MKILYHFRTQGTGAEGVHISGMANAFEQLGHQVTFVSPTGRDPRATAGANPFARGEKRGFLARLAAHAPVLVFELLEIGYNLLAWARLHKVLAAGQCDLIYERHAFFLCATGFLAQRAGVPLIVEVNELAGDERVRAVPWLLPLARRADRWTFRRASRIVVVSPHLGRRIEALGIAAEKILVLPNAVAEDTLTAAPDGAAIRARFGGEDAIVVGFVGWFVAWHRLDDFLAEAAVLARAEPRLRVLFVGDGPLAAPLAAQAAALGVGERVLFTGPVPHSAIAEHIAAMDVCVIPHSNEYRSPMKLFESMVRGRAILAPRTEPIASVLTHGENGLLFAPADFAEFRALLGVLIADAGLRARLGAAARRTVEERHTWSHNALRVLRNLRSDPTWAK